MQYEEDKPIPKPDGPAEFEEFLVPARNNIQIHLLRMQRLIGYPPSGQERPTKRHTVKATPEEEERYAMLGALIGAGFSLWRAVFQASNELSEPTLNLAWVRWFLNQIIRNNMAAYQTELNSWSLAEFRMLCAERPSAVLRCKSTWQKRRAL
jgi:hypothetical protein